MDDVRIENSSGLHSRPGPKVEQKEEGDFEGFIKEAVRKVDGREKDANRAVLNLLEGKGSVHETMISMQQADISMRLLLSVRNKVIEAYRKIMRMQF